MNELTERERDLLDFAGGPHWRWQGSQEDEVRRRFGLSLTRYHQAVGALLDRPEALVYAPATVKRLQRLRDTRRGQRRSA